MKTQLTFLNDSIKYEKHKFASLISKHKHEIEEKDSNIKYLQLKLTDNNDKLSTFSFGGKNHSVPLVQKQNSNLNISSEKDFLQCDQCSFQAPNAPKLKIHKNTIHKETFQCDICFHILETPRKLKHHKESSHSTSLLD